MSVPFAVAACKSCGHAVFPRRILCPRCGARTWRDRPAGAGDVEATTVRRPRGGAEVHLVEVRTDAGPVVVARCAVSLDRGARVRLRTGSDGAIEAVADARGSQHRRQPPH